MKKKWFMRILTFNVYTTVSLNQIVENLSIIKKSRDKGFGKNIYNNNKNIN